MYFPRINIENFRFNRHSKFLDDIRRCRRQQAGVSTTPDSSAWKRINPVQNFSSSRHIQNCIVFSHHHLRRVYSLRRQPLQVAGNASTRNIWNLVFRFFGRDRSAPITSDGEDASLGWSDGNSFHPFQLVFQSTGIHRAYRFSLSLYGRRLASILRTDGGRPGDLHPDERRRPS